MLKEIWMLGNISGKKQKDPIKHKLSSHPSCAVSIQSSSYSLRLIPANSKSNVLGVLNIHKDQKTQTCEWY